MSNVEQIEKQVKAIVAEQLGVKETEVTNEASFVDDLGADSLDTVELDLTKQYVIAFPHRSFRTISSSYGNLPNVEAGPRYSSRDILDELMKSR